jgi:hypothetical protein
MTDLIEIARQTVSEPERDGALVANDVLSGFWGSKLIGMLQRIARRLERKPATCYEEIGVFHGLTLLSDVVAAPNLKLWCYEGRIFQSQR